MKEGSLSEALEIPKKRVMYINDFLDKLYKSSQEARIHEVLAPVMEEFEGKELVFTSFLIGYTAKGMAERLNKLNE